MSYKSRRLNKHRFTPDQCARGGRAVRGGEFAEEARLRALHDAKGRVLREGVTYSVHLGELVVNQWQKRRALRGRVDQVELLCNGRIIRTTGETCLRNGLRWLKGGNFL